MKNPEKAYFWAELISRQLEDTLNEEEIQLLEEWLAKEASHRELLDNLRSSAYLQEKSRIHGLFASPQGFQIRLHRHLGNLVWSLQGGDSLSERTGKGTQKQKDCVYEYFLRYG